MNSQVDKIMIQTMTFASYFGANFMLEKPRREPVDLPSKGMKGLSNAELNGDKCGKNKRKKRRK